MFTALPASKALPSRTAGQAALSIVLHAALLATAVWVTARSGGALASADRQSTVVYVEPTPAPQPPAPVEVVPLAATPPVIAVPLEIPTVLPPIPLAPVVETQPPRFTTGGVTTAAITGAPVPAAHDPQAPWEAAFVDKPVDLLAGQPSPRYPETLRGAGVEGRVLAKFVVDTTGYVERGSIEVLESTHTLFASAVRSALVRQRFVPAEVRGRRVRQLVTQPFEFRIRP